MYDIINVWIFFLITFGYYVVLITSFDIVLFMNDEIGLQHTDNHMETAADSKHYHQYD